MPALPSDHNHLRSGMLMDVVPPGKGNALEGRLLREHARMLTDHLERLSIEVTELHRLLIVRLGNRLSQIYPRGGMSSIGRVARIRSGRRHCSIAPIPGIRGTAMEPPVSTPQRPIVDRASLAPSANSRCLK